jgi:DNA sulfur modification protein DndB
MFARTPKGKLLAFSGAQFGRRVYHTAVDVNELKTWTFNDDLNAGRKISRRALAPGSHATTLSPIVLGTTQSLTTMQAKGSPDLEYLHLTDDIDWTVISGHDTIAALAGDMERTSHISVEFHTGCEASHLAQWARRNNRAAATTTHATRSVLDDRGEWMTVTQQTIEQVAIFTGRVDMTKTALSNRSRNLFTFSAIHQANQQLLADHKQQSVVDRVAIAVQFWNTVAANMPDWQAAYDEKILPADYRREFVCAHGIALAGLARLGRSLLSDYPKTWPAKLRKLRTLNWRRTNTATWEGRAMIAGRLSKASTCVVLTGNVLKQTLGVPLSEHETAVESSSQTARR